MLSWAKSTQAEVACICLASKVASQGGIGGQVESSPVKVEEAVLGHYQGRWSSLEVHWADRQTGRDGASPPLHILAAVLHRLPGATVTRGKDRHEVAASLGERLAGITGLELGSGPAGYMRRPRVLHTD